MNTISIKREVTIAAAAGDVFPLLCPVREYEWIPGWKCQLLYCPNGRNEKDVVFKEKMTSPFLLKNPGANTTWVTLLHDRSNYRVHFRWINHISTSICKMEMLPLDTSQTRCTLSLQLMMANDQELRDLSPNAEHKIGFLLEGLAAMLKHYCETGEILKSKRSKRKSEFIGMLTTSEKLTFVLSKMIMKLMRDRDRISYLSKGRISCKTLNRKVEINGYE